MVKCECCGEEVDVEAGMKPFTVKLDSLSNGIEMYEYCCNKCISTWFIERPDDITYIEVKE